MIQSIKPKDSQPSGLEEIADTLLDTGKCVLAIDGRSASIREHTRTNRCAENYFSMLAETPRLEEFTSGAILSEQSLRLENCSGRTLADVLTEKGVLIGVSVDRGTTALPNFSEERITEGLDGLRKRLPEYRSHGAQFTRWHAEFSAEDSLPTSTCLKANAQELARFAALSQEEKLLPIVAAEVLMDGSHSVTACEEATCSMLDSVFRALKDQRVSLSAMLLETNMVIQGNDNPNKTHLEEVAKMTLHCLRRMVPVAMPGILLTTGSQGEITATKNLNALNRSGDMPWKLSLVFDGDLHTPVLRAWNSSHQESELAQKIFSHRGESLYHARFGYYTEDIEERLQRFQVTTF